MPVSLSRFFLLLGFLAATSIPTAHGQLAAPPKTLSVSAAKPAKPAAITPATADEADGIGQVDPNAAIEVVTERYPSGKIKIRREVTQDEHGNYVRHGEWTMFDEAGNVIASGQHHNHRRHGKWMRTHLATSAKLFAEMPFKEFTGPFTSQAEFRNGDLNGKWIFLDHKHNKIAEWDYVDGLRQGFCRSYYSSGKIREEASYRDGLLDGQLRVWDKDGKVVVDENYQDGRKLALKVQLDRGGRKEWEGMYLHAQNVIDRRDDWWNALPVQYKQVGNDVRHGHWTSWHPSGQKRDAGTYQHDLPDGQFTWWYPTGQQKTIGSFKNGAKYGLWVWWHASGQKATEGHYVDGEPSGAWAYWKEDGRLYQKSDFSENNSVAGPAAEPAPLNGPQMKTSKTPTLESIQR